MTYAQIVEKRNRILAEAGTIAQGKDKTAETRAKVINMLAEADNLAEDAKIAKALETHADELRSAGRPPRGEIGAANQVESEQRAFRDWMRTGTISAENRTYLSETRDMGSFTGVGMGTKHHHLQRPGSGWVRSSPGDCSEELWAACFGSPEPGNSLRGANQVRPFGRYRERPHAASNRNHSGDGTRPEPHGRGLLR